MLAGNIRRTLSCTFSSVHRQFKSQAGMQTRLASLEVFATSSVHITTVLT
jgi:hypothetical protein